MPAKSKKRRRARTRTQKAEGRKTIRPPLTYSEATRQLGTTGIRRVGPYVRGEYLTELQGRIGRAKYREMYNHDVVRRALRAVKLPMLQATWTAQGAEGPDAEAATEFLQGNLDDMVHSWPRFMDDAITGTGTYGASIYQTLYKRRQGQTPRDEDYRSEYDDGLWGWREFSPRGQETWDGWVWDEDGKATRLIQSDEYAGTAGRVEIPLEQCVHFILEGRMGDPNGESLLRAAYIPYYGLKHADDWCGILIERMGGVPVFTVAEQEIALFDTADADMVALRDYLEDAATAFRLDEQMGAVMPWGVDFDLLAPPIKIEDVINYIQLCSWRILGSVLAQFLELGQAPKGSYGKSQSDKEFFLMAEEALLGHVIAETLNRGPVRQLFAMNAGSFRRLDKLPKLVPSDLEVPQLAELAEPLSKLASGMLLTPDDDLQDHLREIGKLPPRPEEEPTPALPAPKPEVEPEGEEDEEAAEEAAEAAKGDEHWTALDLLP